MNLGNMKITVTNNNKGVVDLKRKEKESYQELVELKK